MRVLLGIVMETLAHSRRQQPISGSILPNLLGSDAVIIDCLIGGGRDYSEKYRKGKPIGIPVLLHLFMVGASS